MSGESIGLRKYPAAVHRPWLPVALACLLAGGCGSSAGPAGDKPAARSTASPAAATPPAPGCRAVARPAAKGEQHLPRPQTRLDPAHRYTLELVTNCGTIVIALAVNRAPKTTASVASLARAGFYDGLTFHRVARDPSGADAVIQGGDPLGTGFGGPGYSVVEPPPGDLRYTRGVVAMAKTELEPAGSSGSQFFIVTAEDTGLPPEYALLGTVSGGDGVVSRIAAARTGPAPSEAPRRPIVIERARFVVK
jgi:cyclophilin family peptidyl-prolyl cis-trans isomerase